MSQAISEAYQETLENLEEVLTELSNISFGEDYSKDEIINRLASAYQSYCKTSDRAYNSSLGSDLYRLSDMLDEHLTDEAVENGTVGTMEHEVFLVQSGIEEEFSEGYWRERSSEEDDTNDDTEGVDSSQEQTEDAEHDHAVKALRSPVSPNYEAFVDREAGIAKRMARYRKSEARFFDSSRAKKPSTQQLIKTKLQNRQTKGETTVVNLQSHSTRAHIMSDAGAVSKTIEDLDLTQLKAKIDASKGKKHTVLAQATRWHNNGSQREWNRHRVFLGTADVGKNKKNPAYACYQDNPCITNLSNLIITGGGTYGKDILPLINSLSQEDSESEKVLAQLFIKFAHDAKPITSKILCELGLVSEDAKLDEKRKIYHQLNRTLFLVVQKEVSRQMHRGIDTEPFPFASAIYRALILLRDGHLSMNEVFDADAPYGVFAGKDVMSIQNREKLLLKFRRVFELYIRMYNDVDPAHPFLQAHPKALLVETRESNHQLLLSIANGPSDSEGEEYESSDEETLRFQ